MDGHGKNMVGDHPQVSSRGHFMASLDQGVSNLLSSGHCVTVRCQRSPGEELSGIGMISCNHHTAPHCHTDIHYWYLPLT